MRTLRFISIHSTTRVETSQHTINSVFCEFQSTPPRGWRRFNTSPWRAAVNFNPLHHEGGDSGYVRADQRGHYFNPLHHEGGDFMFEVTYREYLISIHSTTRVETLLYLSLSKNQEFQSTPPRGWRRICRIGSYRYHFYFNPLHHEGGDEDTVQEINRQVEFQSTPPRGWRL